MAVVAAGSVSISIEPQRAIYGSAVRVYGETQPVSSSFTLRFVKPDSSDFSRNLLSDSTGNYQFAFVPDMLGDWHVEVRFSGMYIERIFVVVGISTISLGVDRSVVNLNDRLTVHGSIQLTPAFPSDQMRCPILHFELPDGFRPSVQAKCDSRGNYDYSLTPSDITKVTGAWKIKAEWSGGEFRIGEREVYYDGSASDWLPFEVTRAPKTTSPPQSASSTSQSPPFVQSVDYSLLYVLIACLVVMSVLIFAVYRLRGKAKRVADPSPVARPAVSRCLKCGIELAPSTDYCTECGERVMRRGVQPDGLWR